MGNTYNGSNVALEALNAAGPLTIGLYTEAPDLSGGGQEVTGEGYSRQEIIFDSPADGSMSNSEMIQFSQALTPWGEVVAWALFGDDGTMLRFGKFVEGRTLGIGDFVVIRMNGITLSAFCDGDCCACA